jgi:hypothetical protein
VINLVIMAAVASAATAPLPAPIVSPEEVVVIGKKLAKMKGFISTNVLTRKSRCTVEQSSGDPRIDKATCDIAIACLRQKKEGQAYRSCVEEGRRHFLAQLSGPFQQGKQ